MQNSDYKPHPMDTTHSQPGPELLAVSERLAENTHELWAQERINQGWTYGPERNDQKKQHPGLIPYNQLTEEEKDLDRKTAMGALAAIQALGAEIHLPDRLTLADAPKGWEDVLLSAIADKERQNDVDMNDLPEIDWLRSQSLPQSSAALEILDKEILPAWKVLDKDALVQQSSHRLIAKFAIWPGVTAIALAIAQLALQCLHAPGISGWLAKLEIVSVILAVTAVIFGIFAHRHHGWLASRQKAERLRSLKFLCLSWPELWCDLTAWKNRVAQAREEIQKTNTHEAATWSNEEKNVTSEPVHPPGCFVPPAEILAIAQYYHVKRLEFQSRYFKRQSEKAQAQSWIVRWKISLLCFGLSVLAVAIHNLLHLISHDETHAPSPASIVCIALAALLPVIGFGFRAWLAAFEAPRSRNLYRAKLNALKSYQALTPTAASSTVGVLNHISDGEHYLLGEHREWCRLQMEAEWFV
jgi:hypothetical protein